MLERKSYIVSRQFTKFFIPTIMMTMALSMSIVIDGMIVGNILGPEALAAVNLVLPVTLIFNSLYVLFGVGGSALYSVALGRREKERARQFYTASLAAMLAASLLVLLVGLFLCGSIADALTGNAPNLTEPVYDYLKIVMLEAPLLIVVPGLVYFIRSSGKVRTASAALITANVVNLLLDLVYIVGFDMGIKGAALATGTGYFTGLLIALYGVFHCETLKPEAVPAGDAVGLLKETVSTGLPNTINTVLNFFRLTCINGIVMMYLGSSGVTAFSVCTSCLSIVSMFVGGSAQTMAPLLGTLYGEGDTRGVRFTVKKAVCITGISTVILLVFFEVFARQITGMFGVSDAGQTAIAMEALRIYAWNLPVMGVLFVAMCVYPILGFKKLSGFIALLEGFFLVVPAAFLLARLFGPAGIWAAFPAGEFGTLLILFLITKRIRKKRPGLQGLFLLEKEQKKNVLDVTMIQEISQAVALSEKAIRFCRENRVPDITANKVGLALEEMAVNIIKQKKKERKKSYMDVRITIGEEQICISVRDNGAPYHPFLSENMAGDFDNIRMVLAITDEALYDNILGMNSSIMKISI